MRNAPPSRSTGSPRTLALVAALATLTLLAPVTGAAALGAPGAASGAASGDAPRQSADAARAPSAHAGTGSDEVAADESGTSMGDRAGDDAPPAEPSGDQSAAGDDEPEPAGSEPGATPPASAGGGNESEPAGNESTPAGNATAGDGSSAGPGEDADDGASVVASTADGGGGGGGEGGADGRRSATAAAAGPPEVVDAVELSVSRDRQVGSNDRTESVVEVSFTEPVRHALDDRPLREADVRVDLNGRNVSDRYVLDDDGSAGPGSTNAGQLVLSSNERVEPGDDLTVTLPSVAGPDGEVRDVGTVAVTVTDETAAESAGDGNENTDEAGAFPGAPVAVLADDGEEDLDNPIDVRTRGGRYVTAESTGTNSQVYVFETTDRDETAHYQFDLTDDAGRDSDDNVVQLVFFDLNLTASVDETALNPGDTLRGELNANDAPRPVLLTLDGPGDNVTRETRLGPPASEPTDFAFGPLEDQGEYEVVVNDTLTGDRLVTETVTVAAGDVVLNADVFADERGDVLTVPVDLRQTGRATVVVGSESVGYRATVVVEDEDGDDRVVLEWNTFLADGSADGIGEAFSTVDGDDRVRVRSVRSAVAGGDAAEPEVLDPGSYDLFVRSGNSTTRTTVREPDDLAIVELRPRATGSATILVAAGEVAPDIEEPDDLREARRTGNLTGSDEVTTRDVLVLQVNATGIAGVFEGEAGGDAELLLDGAPPLAVRFEQVDAFNERPVQLRLGPSDAWVVEDRASDAYYLFVDLDGVDVVPVDVAGTADEDVAAESLRTDTRFEGNFTIRGDGGLADREEHAASEFDVVEPEFDVSEPIELPVTANGDVVVSVPTTLAPGTEVDVRLRSDAGSGGAFLKTARTRVARTGRVTVTLSGRDAQLGERVTLTLDAGGTSSTVDGFVGGPGTATVPPPTGTRTAVVVTIPERTPTPTPSPTPTDTGGVAATASNGTGGAGNATATAGTTARQDGSSSTPAATAAGAGAGAGGGTGTVSGSASPGFGSILAVLAAILATLALRRRE